MFWMFMHEGCGSWVMNWVILYAWDGNVEILWVLHDVSTTYVWDDSWNRNDEFGMSSTWDMKELV